jgi:hypothetical protein
VVYPFVFVLRRSGSTNRLMKPRMLDWFLSDLGDCFSTNLRFFISAESLTALRIIPTRWALAVHVKLLMDDLCVSRV